MIMARGAEAVIEKNGSVTKKRVKKSYRLAELDERLRRTRSRSEARLMRAARRAGVRTPQILRESGYEIEMEFVDGDKVRDALSPENADDVAQKIGSSVAKMHRFDIIHGDLTTSNMILSDELCFIDFGLGFMSKRIEDKAVDLHLLRQALDSTHHDIAGHVWEKITESYRHEDAEKVIKTLSKIEERGRYRKRDVG